MSTAPKSTTEERLSAAIVLLKTLTTIVLRLSDDPVRDATAHYEAFADATKDSPEIYTAGMEISGELARGEHDVA